MHFPLGMRDKDGNRGREDGKRAVSMWSIALMMLPRALQWNQGKNEGEMGEHKMRHQTCAVADASLIMFQGGSWNSIYIAKGSVEYLHKKRDRSHCQTPWTYENEEKKEKRNTYCSEAPELGNSSSPTG